MTQQILQNRIKLINAVREIDKIDMGVEEFFVSNRTRTNASVIEYDIEEDKIIIAANRKFTESAEIVGRGTGDTVRVSPFFINRKVTFPEIEGYIKELTDNPYQKVNNAKIVGTANAVFEVCHKGALVRRKKIIAGFMQKLKLTEAEDLTDADFKIDTSKRVTIKTTGTWDKPNAPVMEDLIKLKENTENTATLVVVNQNTYAMMVANGGLRTADNNSTGQVRNFMIDEKANTDKEFYKAGRIIDPRLMLDVYIWNSTKDKQTYIEDGYVFASRKDSMQAAFCGIYTRLAPKTDAVVIPVDWSIEKIHMDDPVVDALVYKSAPIYLPTGTRGYASLKAY